MTKVQEELLEELRKMALDELRPLQERLQATVDRMRLLIEMLEEEMKEP